MGAVPWSRPETLPRRPAHRCRGPSTCRAPIRLKRTDQSALRRCTRTPPRRGHRDPVAGIRLTYIGGGSTRAPGTMAALVLRGAAFGGSEVALVDLDEDHLATVRELTLRMAAARGLDLRVTTTTDRRAGLTDADVVLTSFRPGGFAARHLDECIPPRHGVIGQETQGPGGFFMALRSIHVLRDIVADIEAVAPGARLINYTNPVN